MASQRITVAKLGGASAGVVMRRLRGWSAARDPAPADVWSSEQWPEEVRLQVDAFADRLRVNAVGPPVLAFVEWSDLWSMGDLFARWLAPPGGPPPVILHGDRFEAYGYALPDDGRLIRHLAAAGPQQFPESDQYVSRLRETVEAWQELNREAAIVVLREVVGGLVTDEEVEDSLRIVPEWLAGPRALSGST
jgi:hypothetical protein